MLFYSFADYKPFKDVDVILDYYKDKKVGELIEDVLECCEEIEKSDMQNPELFSFLIQSKLLKKSDI